MLSFGSKPSISTPWGDTGERGSAAAMMMSASRGSIGSSATAQKIDAEVCRLVEAGLADATRIISEKREDLETLAKGLFEYETLTGEEIVELLKGHPPIRDTGSDHEPPLRGSPVPTTGVVRPKPGPKPGGLEPQPQA